MKNERTLVLISNAIVYFNSKDLTSTNEKPKYSVPLHFVKFVGQPDAFNDKDQIKKLGGDPTRIIKIIFKRS